jgi:hypothetical protein
MRQLLLFQFPLQMALERWRHRVAGKVRRVPYRASQIRAGRGRRLVGLGAERAVSGPPLRRIITFRQLFESICRDERPKQG